MELFISPVEIDDACMLIDYFNIVKSESDYLTYDEFKLNEFQEMEVIQEVIDDTNSCMLLGFIDDELVSVASLIGNNNRMSHTSELGISVKKDYYNMSIGTSMMEELIEYATNNGIKVIYLEVRSDNVNAIKLYKKFNFIKTGYIPNRLLINDEYYNVDIMCLTF